MAVVEELLTRDSPEDREGPTLWSRPSPAGTGGDRRPQDRRPQEEDNRHPEPAVPAGSARIPAEDRRPRAPDRAIQVFLSLRNSSL
jgi:hypothetical protein